MRMRFRGWKREVKPHLHNIGQVIEKEDNYAAASGPISWHGPMAARGQIKNVSLTGNFLVEIDFVPEELRNWLSEYVKSEPEAALRLLSEMQTEAIIALAKSHTVE